MRCESDGWLELRPGTKQAGTQPTGATATNSYNLLDNPTHLFSRISWYMMAEQLDPSLPLLLQLPGEIRNRIYHHIVLTRGTIYLSAGPRSDKSSLKYSPPVPPLAFACRRTYGEVKSVYYEENSFHFTEYALRAERIEEFRRRAASSAKKLASITITRAFGVGVFAGRLQFTAKRIDGKIQVDDFTSNSFNGHFRNRDGCSDGMCYCMVRKLASCSSSTLLEFVEDYLKKDGTWQGEQHVATCRSCRKSAVVPDARVKKERGAALPLPECDD